MTYKTIERENHNKKKTNFTYTISPVKNNTNTNTNNSNDSHTDRKDEMPTSLVRGSQVASHPFSQTKAKRSFEIQTKKEIITKCNFRMKYKSMHRHTDTFIDIYITTQITFIQLNQPRTTAISTRKQWGNIQKKGKIIKNCDLKENKYEKISVKDRIILSLLDQNIISILAKDPYRFYFASRNIQINMVKF